MPRGGRVPSYRLFKRTKQAVVTINGHDHYLGPHGSPESKERYARLIAEAAARQTAQATDPRPNDDLTVTELIAAYWSFAESYYLKEGRPTDELNGIRASFRRLRDLYGRTRAADFGPRKLKVVRQTLIDNDLSRKYINDCVGRIRRMFRWGVENELVAASVYQALMVIPFRPRTPVRQPVREYEPHSLIVNGSEPD